MGTVRAQREHRELDIENSRTRFERDRVFSGFMKLSAAAPDIRQSQNGPPWQLTGAVDGCSLRLALLGENALNLGRVQQASDLVHTHLGSNRLIPAEHLRAQAGCRLASREIGAVHPGLVDNNIVVRWAGTEGG
jgi:hypothetical protein